MTTLTGAQFIPHSHNRKTGTKEPGGRVAATYASIKATCPTSCELRKSRTCYAMSAFVGVHVSRLDKTNFTAIKVAQQEAKLIRYSFNGGPIPQDGARGGRDLRLHVAGDCRTKKGATSLGMAARAWRKRGGGAVWTYTHAWRTVPRSAWTEHVKVLASIESVEDVTLAAAQGYNPARVVPEFPNGAKAWLESGIRWIPCPAQTKEEVRCSSCRLCLNELPANSGIAFEAHGVSKNRLKSRLPVLQGQSDDAVLEGNTDH